MMRGRIWLESEEGVGSTFHFTVRLGTAPAPLKQESRADIEALERMPVLVVDDNDSSRRVLNDMLSANGLKTTPVDSGQAAWEALLHAAGAGYPFPLAVIDAHMPALDGFTLAERILAEPELEGTKIVVLISSARREEAERCRDLGVSAWLTKPAGERELLEALAGSRKSTAKTETSAGPESGRVDSLETRLHLLVVEDNPVNALVARRVFEKGNHTVKLATNGRQALEMIERETFDCVLMDVQMPILDGFETTAEIRRKEQSTGGHLAIIAMTAHAMAGDLERCLAAGMDGYLTKPIHPKNAFDSIARVLQRLGC